MAQRRASAELKAGQRPALPNKSRRNQICQSFLSKTGRLAAQLPVGADAAGADARGEGEAEIRRC
jgi:hypothetical protein